VIGRLLSFFGRFSGLLGEGRARKRARSDRGMLDRQDASGIGRPEDVRMKDIDIGRSVSRLVFDSEGGVRADCW
jgi:hypothetical protein